MSQRHRDLTENVRLDGIKSTQWMACKAVLNALAGMADDNDLCWPGVELLMIRTGASERVISRITGLLHEQEWIVRKRRSGTSNLYRLNVAKLKAHQVQRPDNSAAAQYLPGMAFADEEATPAAAAPKLHIVGRSTARKRAETPPEQRKPPRGGAVAPDRRDRRAESARPSRQIGDRAVRDRSENRQASSRPAPSAAPTRPPAPSAPPPRPAPELPAASAPPPNRTSACLPASRAGKTQGQQRLAVVPDTPGGRFLAGLSLDKGLPVSRQVMRQHHKLVTGLLESWQPDDLAEHLRHECRNANRPMGRLVTAIRDTQPRLPAAAPESPVGPWCGSDGSDGRDVCLQQGRQRVSAATGASYPCPECNPSAQPAPKTRVLGRAPSAATA